jgi:phosphate butyryltransferase
MPVTRLDDLIPLVKSRPMRRIAVANGQDHHTIQGLNEAIGLGFVQATLVGDEPRILEICKEDGVDPGRFQIIHEPNAWKAGQKAVELVNTGDADLLMKGLMTTDDYMRIILNKERGMCNPGAIISHVSVIDIPTYPKLITVSDVAIIPQPDLTQKIAMTKYLIETAHRLGIERPKLAIISASEKVSPKIPSSMDAALLSMMGDRNQIPGAIIDGPMALDLAIDPYSAEVKGFKGAIQGDADCILFPTLETGNTFYKSLTKFCKAELGAVVMGARKPAILTSRGDSEKTKLYAIALGALMA